MWWRRDKWWRRIFEDMFREFEEIDEMFERMMRSMERTEGKRVEGPYFYGFSLTIGPDGKPKIREFGNVRPSGVGVVKSEVREPFVDVVYDKQNDQVTVIAEMPGVSKENVKVEATEDSVHIYGEEGDRKYETTVNLEVPIDPDSAKATFNNGVLQVVFKTKRPMKPKGVRIKID